jgi:hypothetical protein
LTRRLLNSFLPLFFRPAEILSLSTVDAAAAWF